MENPTVSVIMITYNRATYLPESVQSVLQQSFRDLELIIVDDGSNDGTREILEAFGDDRIRYFHFDHTGFASRLRNFGITRARGKYIAFLDSDDLWQPNKLQVQEEIMRKNATTGFTFTNVIEFDTDGRILKNGIYSHLNPESLRGNIFQAYVRSRLAIYPSTMLFDRRCLEKTGPLSERFPWTDNAFFHRLAFHFTTVGIVKPLVKIRKHSGNTSSRLGLETVSEMIDAITSYYQEGMINKRVFRKMMAHYYYLSGILHLRKDHFTEARKEFVNCILYNPLKIKAWIRSILSTLRVPQRS